jgi:hypothetical protein
LIKTGFFYGGSDDDGFTVETRVALEKRVFLCRGKINCSVLTRKTLFSRPLIGIIFLRISFFAYSNNGRALNVSIIYEK